MARIRTIKPDTFEHEVLNKLDYRTRWIWVGLWTRADRFGRLEDRPERLQRQILGYEREECMDAEIQKLADAGFLVRYEVDGVRYIAIPSWTKHQRITGTEATQPEKIPPPSGVIPRNTLQPAPEIHGNTPESHRENGPISRGNDPEIHGNISDAWKRKGNGVREGNGDTETGTPADAVAPRGARARPATTAQQPNDPNWGAMPTRPRRGHIAWEAKRRNLSVPHELHAELRDASGWTEAELLAWYPKVEAAYDGQPIGDEVWKFWRVRMREELGTTVKPATTERNDDDVWNQAMKLVPGAKR